MRQNEKVVRDALDAFISGDIERLSGFLTDDLVVHVPDGLPIGGEYHSRDEFLGGMLGKVVAALGGPPQLEVHDITSSDDHVVGIYTISATKGGTRYEWRHTNIYHVTGDKISEFWWNPYDHETVKEALS